MNTGKKEKTWLLTTTTTTLDIEFEVQSMPRSSMSTPGRSKLSLQRNRLEMLPREELIMHVFVWLLLPRAALGIGGTGERGKGRRAISRSLRRGGEGGWGEKKLDPPPTHVHN